MRPSCEWCDDGERGLATHVCALDCSNVITDEFLVHGRDYEPVGLEKVAWYKNLVQVEPEGRGEIDEMAAMREEAERRKALEQGRVDNPPRPKKEKDKKKEKDVVDASSKKRSVDLLKSQRTWW